MERRYPRLRGKRAESRETSGFPDVTLPRPRLWRGGHQVHHAAGVVAGRGDSSDPTAAACVGLTFGDGALKFYWFLTTPGKIEWRIT
jgi:hypothetical protein